MSARVRVFVAAVAGQDRRRLLDDAAGAGWIVVDRPGDADLVLGPTSAWPGDEGVPMVAGATRPCDDERPVEALTPRAQGRPDRSLTRMRSPAPGAHRRDTMAHASHPA